MERPVTERELRAVRRQLGRDDAYATAVAVHCRLGHPAVVYHDPFAGPAPNPTLYWLTCPWLKLLVDQIEAAGMARALERRYRAEPDLAARVRSEGEGYNACLRERLDGRSLPPAGDGFIAGCDLPSRGERFERMRRRLMTLHIGGSADPLTVKCLHAHVAVRLAGFPSHAGDAALDEVRRANAEAHDFILGRVFARA